MRVIIQGIENVTRGLNNMANEIPRATQVMLDRASMDVKTKMAQESPKNTGALARSVTVSTPNQWIRWIEPLARNFMPGNRYALPVEEGSSAGSVPNVMSIAQYFGVDKKVAWAIALSISKKGTPSNPFVLRTFSWVRGMIQRQIQPFISQITVQFAKGAL